MKPQIAQKIGPRPLEDPPLTVDFLGLKAQFATIREEVIAAITGVVESLHFIPSPEVKLLEDEVAAALGVKHAVGCASGTDALTLSLRAADIGPGDEVITTPFSPIATSGSIAQVGAKPVFVDIDLGSYNIDPSLIERAITPNTRAIMPAHLFGLPAQMEQILTIARQHGLAVIEDAGQAIGSRYRGQHAGTVGDVGSFSLFPSKNLGGAGDGGIITTNDDAMAERLRMLRVHASRKKYRHDMLGTNSGLDALQAAILRVKFRHLDQWNKRRRERAERYRKAFESLNLLIFTTPPALPGSGFHHVYNQFTVRCGNRDHLQRFLRQNGIATGICYPLCLHLQPAFAYLGHASGDFPAAEKASKEALSLPVYPELTNAQQDQIMYSIAAFYRRRATPNVHAYHEKIAQ